MQQKLKKIGENEFVTSTILIDNADSIIVSKFIYDKDYKILKIQKNALNEFLPSN